MAKSSSKKQRTSLANPKPAASSEPLNKMAAPYPENDESGLGDLFLDSIKDIYWAENHLVKNLPKMIKAAGSADLQNAFTDHLEVTKEHVERLENIFDLLGEKKQAKKCDAMEGLSIEGEGIIESTLAGTTARDAGLIMAAQKVEHYEIATYGGLMKLAIKLGKPEVASILNETLAEEQEADATLSGIAEAM